MYKVQENSKCSIIVDFQMKLFLMLICDSLVGNIEAGTV